MHLMQSLISAMCTEMRLVFLHNQHIFQIQDSFCFLTVHKVWTARVL